MGAAPPKNVFVSWSLNPQIFIDNEEHGTASISQRLASARALSDNGVLVGFHFHPIVFYNDYQEDYSDIIQNIRHMFRSDEIAMISMGTLTFIKSAINKLRRAGLNTKVLQIPMSDAAGKSSYSLEIKKEQIKEKLKSLQQEEIKLAKELEEKYGNGEISLESGEFLPSK